MGVLFDLDGTLVGSEHLAPLAWAAVLREVGVRIPAGSEGDKEVAQNISTPAMRGSAASAIAQHLIASYDIGTEHSSESLAARKRAVAVEMVVSGGIDLAPLWFEGKSEAKTLKP
jgi:beta-phosphoglucomutase-like phosphatase (HAD superfamily)